MTEALIELGEVVAMAKPEAVKAQRITYDELTLVSDAGSIIKLLKFLQGNAACQFTTLVDICGVDYPDREQRFEVVYHLLSMRQNHRIRISVPVAEDEIVPSCIELYPAA
ncbi:MAG: NADH-quinone oxidoreductase subunit C, partial [Paracoccaceae bacterium]|nr:NADH-quinone oxidoreductase subunit C [Paracoccaceae bacterium]